MKKANQPPKVIEIFNECEVCKFKDTCPIANINKSFELMMAECKHWN